MGVLPVACILVLFNLGHQAAGWLSRGKPKSLVARLGQAGGKISLVTVPGAV